MGDISIANSASNSLVGWQLRNRAVRAARSFFSERDILEALTPKAVASPALEPYIDAVELRSQQHKAKLYLATSPEFSLKKYFFSEITTDTCARGIYEIAPVFRDDTPSKHHALEFTMVEWYTKDTALADLFREAHALILHIAAQLALPSVPTSYAIANINELFKEANCSIEIADPASVNAAYAKRYGNLPDAVNPMDASLACFNLLFDEIVLPVLRRRQGFIAVVGYPEYLAALAYVEDGIAQRGEIYYNGLELANGYREEWRPEVARARWQRYNDIRALRGAETYQVDDDLLASLHTMRGVSGIALGLERTLMALGAVNTMRAFKP